MLSAEKLMAKVSGGMFCSPQHLNKVWGKLLGKKTTSCFSASYGGRQPNRRRHEVLLKLSIARQQLAALAKKKRKEWEM